MKIVIESDSLIRSQAGIAKFNKNLIDELLRTDHKNTYQLYCFGDPFRKSVSHFNIDWLWIPRKIYMAAFKAGIRIPYDFLTERADIYLFPNFIRLPTTRGKVVTFVHDLAYLKYPETLEPKNLLFLRRFLPKSVKESDHIVVISESTKKDILQSFGINQDKVSVVYPALPKELVWPSQNKVEEFKSKLKLGKYILFVGTLEPRKNIPRLIKAVESLPPEYSDISLVLAGKRAWAKEEIDQAIRGSSLGDRLVELGAISDEDLSCLYKGAFVFAFPSLYEGFGIPVLEAFSAGVPVVTSRVSSLPEVGGDAAILIDPTDPASISSGLLRVLSDEKFRKHMIGRGEVQLKRFSWQESAEKMMGVWDKVAN